jgi:hypothetical protein
MSWELGSKLVAFSSEAITTCGGGVRGVTRTRRKRVSQNNSRIDCCEKKNAFYVLNLRLEECARAYLSATDLPISLAAVPATQESQQNGRNMMPPAAGLGLGGLKEKRAQTHVANSCWLENMSKREAWATLSSAYASSEQSCGRVRHGRDECVTVSFLQRDHGAGRCDSLHQLHHSHSFEIINIAWVYAGRDTYRYGVTDCS